MTPQIVVHSRCEIFTSGSAEVDAYGANNAGEDYAKVHSAVENTVVEARFSASTQLQATVIDS